MIRITHCSLLTILLATAATALPAQDVAQPEEQAAETQPEQQQNQEAEPAPEPEPSYNEFETAGFSFGTTYAYEPVVRESSDGRVYSVTYQRRAPSGGALGTDGRMAFVRLTQTIEPLGPSTSIKEFLDDTVRSAVAGLGNIFNDTSGFKYSDSTLEILGEERLGMRIDAGTTPSGKLLYAECYAFETEQGNAIGVAIKLLDPGSGELPEGVLLADELLAGLEIHDLKPETPYYHALAGYPIRLPVGSAIQNTRSVNEFVQEMNVVYPRGNARIQVINTPAELDPKQTATEQVRGYAATIAQQNQRGQLDLKYASNSVLLSGEDGSGVVEGMIFGIDANATSFFNSMYAVNDGRRVVAVSFTGAEHESAVLTLYARDFFARPMTGLDRARLPMYMSPYTLDLPNGLRAWGSPHSDAPREFIIDLRNAGDWASNLRSSITTHGGHTHLRLLGQGANSTLESAHLALCAELHGLLSDAQGSDQGAEFEPRNVSIRIDDEQRIEGLSSSFLPRVSSEELERLGLQTPNLLRVSSYLLPPEADRPGVVISSVSSAQTHADTEHRTRWVTDHLAAMANPGQIEAGFGFIELPERNAYAITNARSAPELIQDMSVFLGDDEMRIRTYAGKPEHSTLSSRRLAEEYLRPEWMRIARGDDRDVYPTDSEGLEAVQVAGWSGVMFQSPLSATEYGDQQEPDHGPAHARVIGFTHNDQYTTVTITARGDQGGDRLDQLMSLLHADATDDQD